MFEKILKGYKVLTHSNQALPATLIGGFMTKTC
jgi:hypothetical protein